MVSYKAFLSYLSSTSVQLLFISSTSAPSIDGRFEFKSLPAVNIVNALNVDERRGDTRKSDNKTECLIYHNRVIQIDRYLKAHQEATEQDI